MVKKSCCLIRSSVFLLVFGLAFSSCTPTKTTDDIYQLAGDWKSTTGPLFYESWKISADSSLAGIGFSINDADTLVIEKMRIERWGDSLVFSAVADKQNAGEAIAFGLAKTETNGWVFENLLHDYPNRIIYRILNDSIMEARIENTAGNKARDFHFKRISP
ncbi:MAG: hypothetical protein KJ578_05500 [Bacteroidetes bacterium]|nr:hypothetical protein [Bacteroidota bacterium]MBU1580162.1 hypothetical protein [Bacteroidota bacterium]MBU2465889.1 hypothetical protein [Bacteroidota bacterium]MBU2557220.1 hypothetical protein [Bacteroidota bacterium]